MRGLAATVNEPVIILCIKLGTAVLAEIEPALRENSVDPASTNAMLLSILKLASPATFLIKSELPPATDSFHVFAQLEIAVILAIGSAIPLDRRSWLHTSEANKVLNRGAISGSAATIFAISDAEARSAFASRLEAALVKRPINVSTSL